MLAILKQCSACSLHSFGVLRMKQQRADAARVPKEKPRTLARLMDGGPLQLAPADTPAGGSTPLLSLSSS